MKRILTIVSFLVMSLAQSQTLEEIAKPYLSSTATTDQLREGILKVERKCSSDPEEKCNKAQAILYYLLADDYYKATYQVWSVDKEISNQLHTKANDYYNKGNSFMPITEFPETQKNSMLENKNRLESIPDFNR